MSKYAKLFEYFRQGPELAGLWSIAATEDRGVRVSLPQGASPTHQYQESIDTLGDYHCEIVPYPSVYEDYQINCFSYYDANDSSAPADNVNILELQEVQEICDWIAEQDRIGNLPKITGRKVVSIECNPYVPQIRYVNPEENTVGYFITVRIRYVNNEIRKSREFNGS